MKSVRTGLFFLLLFFATPAFAQTDEFHLNLSRDFGYGGFGEIEGNFTMKASGPADLVSVQFMMDGEVVSEDAEPPFRFSFRTEDFSLGPHVMSASGKTADGRTLTSNEIREKFVSADVGWKAAGSIIIPVFVLLGVAMVLSFAGPWMLEKITGKKRARKGYGVSGGAICPKCGKPFALRLLAPNLGLSKFDRCPHCGKWSVVRPARREDLEAAEQAMVGEAPVVEELSAEEKLRKQLEESRFEGG